MSPVHALLVLAAALGGEPAGEVIDFSGTYCPPCRAMSPIVARLEREGLPIRQVDIQQDRALADRFHVTGIPTFVLVINGEEVTRIVGQTTEAELRRLCSRIPQAAAVETAAPAVQLASNPPQSRSGVSQPLGKEAPADEPQKKSNRFLDMLGLKRRGAQAEVRGNNEERPSAAEPPAAEVAGNDPMASSVRIRATIKGQISLGSGTIVHSEQGNTLIVTCGHIFKNIDDASKIEVDVIQNGKTYVASIIDFDLSADVGVIRIPTHDTLSSTPVAPATLTLAKAEVVGCIGCSAGSHPTREQLTVTAVNKYDGPDNIECTGTPVQGRSGGGLFNADKQLVGVCIAAVMDEPLGVYAHVFAVHKLLDKNKLTHLYQPAAPQAEEMPKAFVADAGPAEMPADFGMEASDDAMEPAAEATESFAATEPVAADATDLVSAMSDIPAGDAEVVVIIRSRSQPEQSRVVLINRASPKLLAYLNGELRPEGLAANRPAPTSRASSASRARGQLTSKPGSTQSVTQPTSFQPPQNDDRSLSRRMAEARRGTATPKAAK